MKFFLEVFVMLLLSKFNMLWDMIGCQGTLLTHLNPPVVQDP